MKYFAINIKTFVRILNILYKINFTRVEFSNFLAIWISMSTICTIIQPFWIETPLWICLSHLEFFPAFLSFSRHFEFFLAILSFLLLRHAASGVPALFRKEEETVIVIEMGEQTEEVQYSKLQYTEQYSTVQYKFQFKTSTFGNRTQQFLEVARLLVVINW